MLQITVRCLLLLLLLFNSGCDRHKDPARMTSGKELYNYYCQNCHAKRGPGAAMEHAQSNPPLQDYQIIMLVKYGYRQGNHKHQMPHFSQISDQQAEALANYVVQLQHSSTAK